jgi:hypothetical protein
MKIDAFISILSIGGIALTFLTSLSAYLSSRKAKTEIVSTRTEVQQIQVVVDGHLSELIDALKLSQPSHVTKTVNLDKL